MNWNRALCRLNVGEVGETARFGMDVDGIVALFRPNASLSASTDQLGLVESALDFVVGMGMIAD